VTLLGLTPSLSVGSPSQIGGYRILRVIGEGSMGTVYEAEQERPRRIVALKIIKPGLATTPLLRRFEQECQVLGRLQHPGIAQIYEAGTADAGHGLQPYLAMELVRGTRLDEHAAKLEIRARLDLMARICDAVEHAHQKGVIHRDLKPANILVDQSGQPKILDFGVARVMDSDVQLTTHSEMGQILGTLPYMSPEQVTEDAGALDTRSDVYAIGVILYQVLAGRLPYEVKKTHLAEGVRIIREKDPSRLSVVNRTFRGDVEVIAAKALSKEKEQRYQSAADLAADIRRYLKDEPIVARPPSTAYQLRKFARRHRALVAGLAAAFAVLLVGVVISSWQALRATRAEKVAKNEAAKAEAVNEFLQSMLSAVDPSAMKGREVTVRLVLDEAAKKVADGSLRDQPEIDAAVRTTLGKTYQALGLYPEAEPHLRAALETRRRLLDPEHVDVAASANNLASLLHDQGDRAGAEPLYREAIRIRRQVLGPEHPDLASSLNDLGLLLFQGGDLTNAEPLYRESIAIQRKTLGEEHPDVAQGLNNLAGVLRVRGDVAAAESLYRESLAMRRKVLGDEHPDVAQGLSNLAALLQAGGDLAGAEPLYRESVAIRRKALGDEHPDLAVSLNNLATVLRFRGDLAGAELMQREALAIWRKTLGEEHPNVAAAISNLGSVLQARGDLIHAEPLQRQALAIRRKAFGDEHATVARSLYFVGSLLVEKGDLAGAEPMLRQALAIHRNKLAARHVDTASDQTSLGLCLIRRGQYAEAETLLVEALSIREEKLPVGHWARFETQSILGEALAGQEKFEPAESLLLSSYEGIKNDVAVPAAQKRAAFERVERLYATWGRPEKAAAWARR
jgi:tetratricopeptide (TPR) repeat protein